MAAERFSYGLDDDGIGGVPVATKFNRVLDTSPKEFLETMKSLQGKIPQVERWAKKTMQDAEQWKKTKHKDSPLSVHLLAAILKYTAQDTEPPLFKHMNEVCYNPARQGLEELVDYIWLLMNAMAMLEPYPNRTVYRGVKKDLSHKFNKAAIGQEFTFHGFVSSTRKVGLMDDPNFCGTSGKRTIFNMQLNMSQARYIAPFSMFPQEEEVLMPPCCRFRLEDVAEQGEQSICQFEEVESFEWIADLRELAQQVRGSLGSVPTSPSTPSAAKPGQEDFQRAVLLWGSTEMREVAEVGAKKGHAECILLTAFTEFRMGQCVDADWDLAQRAAAAGSVVAQRLVRAHLRKERGESLSVEERQDLLSFALAEGYPSFGFHFPGTRLEQTEFYCPSIVKEATHLATMGNPVGQFVLGWAFGDGFGGLVRDPQKAVENLQLSADQGFLLAKLGLAAAYEVGLGVGQDLRKAQELLLQVQAQGVPDLDDDIERLNRKIEG